MANPFDAFDAPAMAKKEANPFDQFDAAPHRSPGDALYATGDASAVLDHYFEHTSAGRLLSVFGQGIENGWGSEPLGLSQETQDFLRKSGVWNDHEKGQNSIVRAFNEALMRPAAAGLDAAMRVGQAAFGAFQSGVEQLGAEVGAPILGRDIAAMPEAFMGSPGGLRRLPLPAEIAKARSLGVIGAGEEGWKGTAETPRPLALGTEGFREFDARADAIKAQREAVAETGRPTGTPEEGPSLTAEAPERPALPDIASDVSAKLVAAGRPQEEADAAAAIVDAHYQARAARFEGAKGTAEELYAAEAPDIQGSQSLLKGAAGKTALEDGRATITLFGKADASTFIHETGHQWLEELMRDAADERAPDDLKADAQTVRDWLGTDEAAYITTRQHEKFARGFERYMMEGEAPTPALAAVFAKFQEWLTALYKTVSRLRSPITDDIRGVFDRMLSGQAPAAEEDFVRQRETQVETVPPEDAAAAASQVRQEAETHLSEKVPEAHEQLSGNRGAGRGAGGGPAPGGAVGGHANAPQPVTGSVAGAEPSGAALPGGGEAAAQGVGAPERPAEPAAPNDLFGPRESTFIDKAGNIRLDNLNTPESVNQVLREAANASGDFMNERRGVIPDAVALDLADALGMDAAKLNLRQIGQAFNAEEIYAARKLLVQSATEVRDLAAKVDGGSEEDLLAYVTARDRHMMIQGQVSGITAEAGRALRAFQSMEGIKEANVLGDVLQATTGRTLFQLRREAKAAAALETPGQVSKFMQDSAKPSFGDMLLEYWINGLISGPATHTTYMVGNALLSLWRAGPETGLAAAIGAARQALGEEGPRVFAGEVPARLYGLMRGLRNGVRAAGEAVKTGQTVPLPGERITEFAVAPRPQAIPDITIGGVPIPIGTIARLPSRMIAAIHTLFRFTNYEGDMAAIAYRQATEEGLEGDRLAARIGEIETDPTLEQMAEARGTATELTLMGKGGKMTQALTHLTNVEAKLPLIGPIKFLKFIDPFVHISSNVIEQSILQRTPVGLLAPQIRAELMGANGKLAQDMAIARMAAGSALAVAIGSLAAEGLASGSGPSDPKEASVWRLTGWQPHSLRFGDTWVDTHRLGPLGMLAGIAADLYEVAHQIGTDDATKVAHGLAHAFTQNILDESFMRGPSDLIRAVTEGGAFGQHYVQQMIASFTPYSVGSYQIARAIDPYARQTRTLMDTIQAKIPWLSETLLPRRDIWGEPIPNKDVVGLPGLSAIYESRINSDPVNRALMDARVFPSLPERKIRGVELSEQQYDDYSRIAGRMAKTRLNAVAGNPGFSGLPESVRVDMIRDAIRNSREFARSVIMMQNPDIMRKASEAKAERLRR